MKEHRTFASFSVNDMTLAREFYTGTLGLNDISMEFEGVLMLDTGGDTRFMVYQKENHVPAGFTVLNFDVNDLDSVVDRLAGKGVTFEALEGTNEKGIADQGTVRAAWTRDPAGNWIGFFQNMN